MKTSLLFISFFCATILYGQDFCSYDIETAINFGENSNDVPFETLELENGKYLIVGTSYFNSTNQFFVSACRLNADNTIDETFDSDGRMYHTWDGRNTGIAATLQADGKILTGGYQAPGNGLSSFRPYVGRLNADGSVDESFGIQGSARLEIQSAIKGSVVGIKELEDGKILAAAVTNNPAGFALVKLTEEGDYDIDFNETGHVLHSDPRVRWQTDYGDALFLSDGSVVIVSKSFSGGSVRSILCKLQSNGELDMDFAESGILEIMTPIKDTYAGIHAALDADENILIGTSGVDSPIHYQVAKVLSATGELDPDFGEDGMSISTESYSFASVHDLTIDPSNGDIYLVGTGTNIGWKNSIWKIDSSGNEIDICDGTSFFSFPFNYTYGIKSAKFFSDGSLKLIGTGGVTDSTSSHTTQNYNFTIPHNAVITGVEDIELSKLIVYPNPAADQLTISISADQTLESVRIVNQMGQIVLISSDKWGSISIYDLAPGIYFAEINLAQGRAVRKFIKQ